MPPKKSAATSKAAKPSVNASDAQIVRMVPRAVSRSTSQIWLEDAVIVNAAKGPGIVTRVWTDPSEDDPHLPPLPPTGPDRQLNDGEIEVTYVDGSRQIVWYHAATVCDRPFVIGDLCRPVNGTDETQVGVVVAIDTELELEGVFSKQRLPQLVPAAEVVNAVRIGRGDHVVSGDWVGVVEEVFEEAMVESSREAPYKICDLGSGILSVGSNASAVLAERQLLLGIHTHRPARDEFKIVLEAEQTCAAICWYAINQQLSPSEHDRRPRPKRYWTDLPNLRLVRAVADHLHFVADKVVFRNDDALARFGALPSQGAGRAQAFNVIQSRTQVTVLWFDGHRSTHRSIDIEPTPHLDEEHVCRRSYEASRADRMQDCWAGDLAIWSPADGSERKLAVVQRADPRERTVDVRWYGTETGETVSALELDPNGMPPEAYGVRRGDLVLIAREPRPTFATSPVVPRIGETEFGFPTEEALRSELSAIGLAHAQSQPGTRPQSWLSTSAVTDVDWYGEVRDLGLDGTVAVALPGGRTINVTADRLIIFDDGFDAELGWGGDDDGMLDDLDEKMDVASDTSWETDENGPDEWADDVDSSATTAPPAMPGAMPGVGGDQPASSLANGHPTKPPLSAPAPPPTKSEDVSKPAVGADDGPWQRFEVLETAPPDHHYIKEAMQQPSRAFMQRVQKEYRVLEESLPDNILVRAYEDRIDLIRALIVGPSHTPYEDAPLLFDIFLAPSKYPYEAPHVFFHSFSGSSRINPNLYTEGKVCLSLLGTWSGERTESWDPSRSSVFQILVSIQGLVLVREPWYLEPGFEKQRGTGEAQTASDMYSQRTWVLARGFIRRALDVAYTGGFDDALRHLYYGPPNRLRHVVEQARDIVARSESSPADHMDVMDVERDERVRRRVDEGGIVQLSKGDLIPLKRTVAQLERLLDAGKPKWAD